MEISLSVNISSYTNSPNIKSADNQLVNVSNAKDSNSTAKNKLNPSTTTQSRQGAAPIVSTQSTSDYNQVINQLKARDKEVKAHELAHLASSGGYAVSGATYTYQVGPDGRRYAVGGEVGIDVSPVEVNLEATIRKAQIIQQAALAPAEPSSQDRQVSAQAAQMAAQARRQLQAENTTGQNENNTLESLNQNNSSDKNSSNPSSDSNQKMDSSRVNFELRLKLNT